MPGTASEFLSLSARDDDAKREFWSSLALVHTSGLGMRRINTLLERFGGAYEAVRASSRWHEAKVPASCVDNFTKEHWRQRALLDWTAAKNFPCGILLWRDDAYPAWLRALPDAPPFLYVSGNVSLLRNVAVAIVGMRACSWEGLSTAAHMAQGISRAGVTVVSGMAKGIDRAAHLAALGETGGSIGVLGAGIDTEYPPCNKDLYALMREKGLLVSEYPPGRPADARSFPVRNRIVSGLARAVIVAEAAVRSGSLNTANHALEQGRELMTVPGAASATTARGCQELVRRGATSVFCADDVLREIAPLLAGHLRETLLERDAARFRYRGNSECSPLEHPEQLETNFSPDNLPWVAPGKKSGKDSRVTHDAAPRDTAGSVYGHPVCQKGAQSAVQTPPEPLRKRPDLSGLDAAVYGVLENGPLHIDDICRALGQDAGSISRTVAVLEIKGYIKRRPGMVYSL